MQLEWDAADLAILEDFRVFLDEHTPPEANQADRASGSDMLPDWARRWQATLFDNGWMVPSYGPELGGRDATLTQTALLVEELAVRGVPRSLHFPGYGIAAPSLLQFGTEKQRALAPAAIRGDTVWCIGMSEPDAGSDLASLRTRCEVQPDHFVLTGQKIWTSYAPVADMCVCYARTDPDVARHGGISALLVDMGTPGIEVRPLQNLGGMTEFAEVFFDAVEVPREALLGELNGGWAVIQGALGHERSTMWLEAVARLERVVTDLADLATAGTPTVDPVVRRRLGTAAERVATLRALGFSSLTGDPSQQLYLKMATSELYTSLLELGTDIVGPFGSVPDDMGGAGGGRDWIFDYLRAFAGTIAGGTSEIQREIVARHALGLPKSRGGS